MEWPLLPRTFCVPYCFLVVTLVSPFVLFCIAPLRITFRMGSSGSHIWDLHLENCGLLITAFQIQLS
jgi:hypothetical protein